MNPYEYEKDKSEITKDQHIANALEQKRDNIYSNSKIGGSRKKKLSNLLQKFSNLKKKVQQMRAGFKNKNRNKHTKISRTFNKNIRIQNKQKSRKAKGLNKQYRISMKSNKNKRNESKTNRKTTKSQQRRKNVRRLH